MQKVRKAVIPAAGYGTRLLPITKAVPKELLPLGNKPVIQYVVEEAVASGVEEIILVCHPSKFSVFDYFQPNSDFSAFLLERGKKKELEELRKIESLATFRLVYQEQPSGLGHAVWCARKLIGDENFLVLLPDVLINHEVSGVCQLLDSCSEVGEWGLLLEEVSREKAKSYGIVGGREVEGYFRIESAVEKPDPEMTPSRFGILGRYLLPPKIFQLIEQTGPGALGEIQLTDAINLLAREQPGRGLVCQGRLFDLGVPEGLLKASNYFQKSSSP